MGTLKYLNPRDWFLFTPNIERVTQGIDPFFKEFPSYLESGLRGKRDQLKIIVKKAIELGFHVDFIKHIQGNDSFSEPEVMEMYEGQLLYWWQPLWSKELAHGFIVNPPIKAKCLIDYWSKRTGENMKGKEIDISNHFSGNAFDIGGGKNLDKVAKCVASAKQNTENLIFSYLVERNNNCVHINCYPINL